MQDNFEHIFEPLKEGGLEERERVSMRNALVAHMREHPARAPWHVRASDALGGGVAWFDSSALPHMRFHPVAAALVLVLFCGVGTSYAAEGALPGDTLYPVKIHVNESVQGALALSPASQAAWNAERATRRLEEAETLAAQGRLTPDAQAQVQGGLAQATEQFDASVSVLAKSDDVPAAAAAQSDLQASLTAHEQVLSALSVALPEVQADVKPILALVRSRAQSARDDREETEGSLAAAPAPVVHAVAMAMKKQATAELEDAPVTAASSSPTAAVSAQVNTLNAKTMVDAGNTQMAQGDYGEAYGAFQAAVRSIHETKENTDALKKVQEAIRERLKAISAQAAQEGESAQEGATTSASIDIQL